MMKFALVAVALPLVLGLVAIEAHASLKLLAGVVVRSVSRLLPKNARQRYLNEWLGEVDCHGDRALAAVVWSFRVALRAPLLAFGLRNRRATRHRGTVPTVGVFIVSGADRSASKVKLATCCSPRSTDSIAVYINKAGTRISAHKTGCRSLAGLAAERTYPAAWAANGIPAALTLSLTRSLGDDESGMGWLEEIDGALAGIGARRSLQRAVRSRNGRTGTVEYTVEWTGDRIIDRTIDTLAALPGVRRVDFGGNGFRTREMNDEAAVSESGALERVRMVRPRRSA
ncbi:MAG: hypothetical protein QOD07_2537 [Frankiaceae bacterium]|jgi:hypothetical protein|nr:hypothetical protein [Frankiaceae bacterium]